MRLTDPDRFISLFSVKVPVPELERLGIKAAELVSILHGAGLRRIADDPLVVEGDSVIIELTSRGQSVPPAAIKQLQIRPPGAPQGIALQEFCIIESRSSLNQAVDAQAAQVVDMRNLREAVLRELAALLNTMNLQSVQDLSRYPQVARSALNYGVMSFAGKAAYDVDPKETARQLKAAIEFFEPRLRDVRVTPEPDDGKASGVLLDFRIDADLWGHPQSQQVTMHTSIEVDTGDVSVAYAAGG
jgi:type VI secretion system protein ImpF